MQTRAITQAMAVRSSTASSLISQSSYIPFRDQKSWTKPAFVTPGRTRAIYRDPTRFSQVVQLSDGSSFFVKSTSPRWLVQLSRDTRNSELWNPRLRGHRADSRPVVAFREKYGDLDSFGL